MTDPAGTLRTFFEAFAAGDGEAMAACYAPDATFRDPVFHLSGTDVGDMWRMLTERARDMTVEYEITDPAHAAWTATYTFRGRPVRNQVRSEFSFGPDGRIAEQTDSFDLPAWAGQALGLPGKLFGRFGFLQRRVRRTSAEMLRRWQQRRDPS